MSPPGATAVAPGSVSRALSLNVILSPILRPESLLMTQNSLVAFPVEPSKFPRLFPERGAPMLSTHLTGKSLGNFEGSTGDRKSTRLNSSHGYISYAVFCLKKKNMIENLGQSKAALSL